MLVHSAQAGVDACTSGNQLLEGQGLEADSNESVVELVGKTAEQSDFAGYLVVTSRLDITSEFGVVD